MYMYMYTCKRMSCIYSMSSTKVGRNCKTTLAVDGPPVSTWSTPWYPITIWTRMFTCHASLPASSNMNSRGQWRPEESLEEKWFFGRGKIITSNQRELTYTPPGRSLWEGEGNGNYQNATHHVTIPRSIPGNYVKSHPWGGGRFGGVSRNVTCCPKSNLFEF